MREIAENIFDWFKKNDYAWVDKELSKIMANTLDSGNVKIDLKENVIKISNAKNESKILGGDAFILFVHEMHERLNRDYLSDVFFLIAKCDSLRESSNHLYELCDASKDSNKLSAAYRQTNLYNSQLSKINSLLPADYRKGR